MPRPHVGQTDGSRGARPGGTAGLATTPDLQDGRDPFFPVVTVPGDSHAGAGRAEPTGGARRRRGDNVGRDRRPPSTPGPAVAESASLELKSTFKNAAGVLAAEMTVDGQTYRPATGETFSYDYRLERVNGGCVEVSAPGARAEMCIPPAQP